MLFNSFTIYFCLNPYLKLGHRISPKPEDKNPWYSTTICILCFCSVFYIKRVCIIRCWDLRSTFLITGLLYISGQNKNGSSTNKTTWEQKMQNCFDEFSKVSSLRCIFYQQDKCIRLWSVILFNKRLALACQFCVWVLF